MHDALYTVVPSFLQSLKKVGVGKPRVLGIRVTEAGVVGNDFKERVQHLVVAVDIQ